MSAASAVVFQPDDPIVARFVSRRDSPLSKHRQLQAAVVDAIEAGDLAPGDRLAGERELSERLGVSLGTTQKAMGQLVADGFLVRRHGHGTFVAQGRRPVGHSWHYRFLDLDGTTELPVYTTLVERRIVDGQGPWGHALGPDPKGYVQLTRRVHVGERFECHAEVYLPASRFGRLMRYAERRLNDVNFKTLLEQDFNAPTLHAGGQAWVRQLPAPVADFLGLRRGTWGLEVHITGLGLGRVPITFQRMMVPPTEHALKLDFHDPREPGGRAAAGS